MELGLCLDDDFFKEEDAKDKPKEKPYNVKLCEREWIFNSPICSDKVEKQNITKFKADVWYRNGQYYKALKSYKFIQDNPQVSSSTVEREIAESIARCYIKLKQFDEAVNLIQIMLKNHGADTSLFLMLAKICSDTDNIQGEIACLKRCISLHSYNHHFWYSLAMAYDKAYKSKDISDFTNDNMEKINTSEHSVLANEIDKALGNNQTTNHKDSLKVYIKCYHCKCFGEIHFDGKGRLKMSSEHFMDEENKNEDTQAERVVNSGSVNNSFFSEMDEIIVFTENLSISDKTERKRKADERASCDISKCEEDATGDQSSQSSANDSHHCPKTPLSAASNPDTIRQEQDQGSCSFSVKLKPSKHYQHQTKQSRDQMSVKEHQKVFAFFCLVRARFHLQRATWTSSSFIKERLITEMAKASERIDKYVLCKCGQLKQCCLKFMSQRIETEDAAILSDQTGEHK